MSPARPIRSISVPLSREQAFSDYELLSSLLGKEALDAKFAGTVLDVSHGAPQVTLATMAQMHQAASLFDLEEELLDELKRVPSVVGGTAYSEYKELVERYLTLLIVHEVFRDVVTALPQHRVLGDSNPDWTLKSQGGEEFYLEVSAIEIGKVIADLRSFEQRVPISRIIATSAETLYFEIIFPDNPRNYQPNDVVPLIIQAAQAGNFPVEVPHPKLRIMVDTLAHRHQLPQIISQELNDMGLMRSTRLIGNRLAFTLATDLDLKEINEKVSQKKKSNKLDKISNSYVCIFVEADRVREAASDMDVITKLSRRVAGSRWLRGVIVAGLYLSPGEGLWRLDYFVIGMDQ